MKPEKLTALRTKLRESYDVVTDQSPLLAFLGELWGTVDMLMELELKRTRDRERARCKQLKKS